MAIPHRIVVSPTSVAEWRSLLTEAQKSTLLPLQQDLESYLVFLLMRFSQDPQISSSIIANDWLESSNLTGRLRQESLQQIGDKCLIFTGLFPDISKKRNVSVDYYVDMGRGAYRRLSECYAENRNHADLFNNLQINFFNLKSILNATRKLNQ